MALWRILLFHIWLHSLSMLSAAAPAFAPAPSPSPPVVTQFASKTHCRRTCGNLTIPFPFGIEEGCYLDDSFQILCNGTEIPILAKSSINEVNIGTRILDISPEGELRVLLPVAFDCYNSSQNQIEPHEMHFTSSFPLSYTLNKLTAVGCDSSANLYGSFGIEINGYVSQCSSQCEQVSDTVNGSCSGMGCRQTYITKEMKDFWIVASSFRDNNHVSNFSPCSYAFIVEEGQYNFSSSDLVGMKNKKELPVLLDWAVGNTTCEEAKKVPPTYACRGNNSLCYEFDNGSGYRCNCSRGYHGNPYQPNGCEDIDECADPSLNQCVHAKSCINRPGSYACSCPRGNRGDGRKDGQGCISYNWPLHKIIIGMCVSGLVALVATFIICCLIREAGMRKVRERFFKENGGLLLQKMLSKTDHSQKRAKIFTEKELKKATNKFNETKVVGSGGHGIVYKGILKDGTAVAIKKSKKMDCAQITQFINEVIVLSQVIHPNVVKLLGCCLETPVPLLVYEFITNNTLYHHLHDEGKASSIPWKTRLRIAAETAAALAHMHSNPSMQIIHRDIKSANILLDDDFTAKISDFGISRLVHLDQTQCSTVVQGTIGYIDPQYYETGLLNEKSDVYSFGMILAELLTGRKVVPSRRDEALDFVFASAVEKGAVLEIIEERVKNEGEEEQLIGVSELTNRCLSKLGDERPTMKDVKKKLEEYLRL